MIFEVDASHALKVIGGIDSEKRSRAAMMESLAYLQTEVRSGMPVDQGIARGSVVTAMSGTALDLTGRVSSSQPHVVVIELGRTPGKAPPPLGPIRAWLARHGKDSGLAFVVARAIGRRGLKGKHIFKTAAEKGLPRVMLIWLRHFKI